MPSLKQTNRPKFSLGKSMLLAALLSSQALLTACASNTVATVDPLKATFSDICISKDDVLTEGTAQKIEATNRKFGAAFSRKSQCPKATGKAKASPVIPAPADPKEPKTS